MSIEKKYVIHHLKMKSRWREKQSFIKYERKARGYGKTKMPLFSKGPVTEFINGITSYSLKPLYFGIFFGFISMLVSILLIVYAIYCKIYNLAIPGSTGIIVAISFFSGVLMFIIGIMGIYLARIFEQTKGRDQYIIKDIIEKDSNNVWKKNYQKSQRNREKF